MLASDWTLQFLLGTMASVESVVLGRERVLLPFVLEIDFSAFFHLLLQATRVDLKSGS